MSIKKQIQWDKKNSKFVGHVDYGNIKAEAIDREATDALVIMASGLQKPWFVPIAYFLTHSLNCDILKQIIIEAIKKLTGIGADVHGIVFDGVVGLPVLEHACLKSLLRLGRSASLLLKVSSLLTCPIKTIKSINLAMKSLKSGEYCSCLADKRSFTETAAVAFLTRVSCNAEILMSFFLALAPSLLQI